MTWWQAVLLGLIQGLTEFIPVSSSGHLVLGEHLLGLGAQDAGVTFSVFVHFGTVLSILTVYWDDVVSLVREMWAALRSPTQLRMRYEQNATFRLGLFIAITLVPTGVVYVLFREPLERAFSSPFLTSAMLVVTGVLLLLTRIRPQPDGALGPLKAFVVGVAQSAAMIPGISRSGATICTAIYQNVRPQQAARFSFLMLLPVVLGATVLRSIPLLGGVGSVHWGPLVTGTVAAYGSGVLAIYVVLDVVRRGNLQYFAYYCFAVGGLGMWLV